MNSLNTLGNKVKGPILILGAGGFIGANLFNRLCQTRPDIFGVARQLNWRLAQSPIQQVLIGDLNQPQFFDQLLDLVKPQTIIDCVGYGGYPFQTNIASIFNTNVTRVAMTLNRLKDCRFGAYVYCGTSSEYGETSILPPEDTASNPNSFYAASKAGATDIISYSGKYLKIPCINLRLYSVYGPWEEPTRLIPQIIIQGEQGKLPNLAAADISRDFVYVDDACESILLAGHLLTPDLYGSSINIASGIETTLKEVAATSKRLFKIADDPQYSYPPRSWDTLHWQGKSDKAKQKLGWQSTTLFAEGLKKTQLWFQSCTCKPIYLSADQTIPPVKLQGLSAIIACYQDGPAISIMYERLIQVFKQLNLDYEIIFVNDGSPDQCEAEILKISREDSRVMGITHSRNFGSQSAFLSGLQLASKETMVLLDGDLQDPPELIPAFLQQFRAGYAIVYGRREKREGHFIWNIAANLFYRLLNHFSEVPIPLFAGDFGLIDRRVANHILSFPERDFFLRGIRAYVGFKQTGVDYVRPKRQFGTSTNSFLRYIGWAKKGILSFSNRPLHMLSWGGILLLMLSAGGASLQIFLKLMYPELVPRSVTTLILVIMFFGSLNLFGIAVIGEYIGYIFNEVKKRPRFIRESLLIAGEKKALGNDPQKLHTL